MSQTHTAQQQRAILQNIARRATLERGLLPTFSEAAVAELAGMQGSVAAVSGPDAPAIRDLTGLKNLRHVHGALSLETLRARPRFEDGHLRDLDALTKHFTAQEGAANKVERQVGKSAAAMLLESRIGEQFKALVTGAAEKGTWARLLTVPVEGRVVRGFEGLDVGDEIRVQLVSVNVKRGFIDFRRVDSTPATTRRTI